MNLDLKSIPDSMKEFLHTLSLMTDEKLVELMTKQGFAIIKMELEIGLMKTEIERRSGV